MLDDDPEQGEGRGQGLGQGRGPEGQPPGAGQTPDRRKCQVCEKKRKVQYMESRLFFKQLIFRLEKTLNVYH